jgi:tRNA threonylcarbamoyladenosine biosynthesis protein TsaB
MRTLAIECATEACSAALFEHGALLSGECRVLGRGHAEALVPMIAALPGKGKAERIAVGLGPGSFTGLRVALAAARALQLAWKCELLGYPTLSLVAAMAQARGAGPVTVCMTGGHGEWFVQDFGPGCLAVSELASLTPQQAIERGSLAHVAGSKAAELVAGRNDGLSAAIDLLPDAREFLRLPPAVLTSAFAPLYGRAPDARLPAGAA